MITKDTIEQYEETLIANIKDSMRVAELDFEKLQQCAEEGMITTVAANTSAIIEELIRVRTYCMALTLMRTVKKHA